jgi:hypothetical protein
MHAIPLRFHVLVDVFMCIFYLQQPLNFINGFISLLVTKSDNELFVKYHLMICFNILSINDRKHFHYLCLFSFFFKFYLSKPPIVVEFHTTLNLKLIREVDLCLYS